MTRAPNKTPLIVDFISALPAAPQGAPRGEVDCDPYTYLGAALLKTCLQSAAGQTALCSGTVDQADLSLFHKLKQAHTPEPQRPVTHMNNKALSSPWR